MILNKVVKNEQKVYSRTANKNICCRVDCTFLVLNITPVYETFQVMNHINSTGVLNESLVYPTTTLYYGLQVPEDTP